MRYRTDAVTLEVSNADGQTPDGTVNGSPGHGIVGMRERTRLYGGTLEAREDIEVVGEAHDGGEAVEQSRLRRPDVVLMDIRMPGVDGIEATRRLAARPDAPRVLVLTTFDVDEYVYEAMRAGTAGFLLKDVRRPGSPTASRTVAAGEALLAPTATRRLIEHFVRRPARARAGRRARLRERAGRAGSGLTTAEPKIRRGQRG